MNIAHQNTTLKGLVASSVTGLMAAGSASGAVNLVKDAIIVSIDSTSPASFDAPWDVDGNGTTDLTVDAGWSGDSSFGSAFLGLQAPGDLVRRVSGHFVSNLDSQQLVGPSSVMGTAYEFARRNASMLVYAYSSIFASTSSAGLVLNETPSIIGFRFERDGNTHYGVANMSIAYNVDNTVVSLVIQDWAWEDQANTPILAGAVVPEPANAAALLGLAAGAAGLSRMRRRR